MYRVVDLSLKAFAAPVGNGDAVMKPIMNYRPGPPILIERINESRPVLEVLSYYRQYQAMSGIQPGEVFQKGMLTSKPYTTYVTFRNCDEKDPWTAKEPAELGPEDLCGHFTIADLTGVQPGQTISVDQLRKAISDKIATRILFIRTDYSKNRPDRPDQSYLSQSPTLSPEAARWLTTLGIRVLGGDVRTFDPRYTGRGDSDIYSILNSAGIVVVEDLVNLDKVEKRHDFVFVGIPLAIYGMIGGPSRVFAVNMAEPTDFVDLSHPLDFYPQEVPDHGYPFVPPKSEIALNDIGDYPNPWPGRIEPREDQATTMRNTRLTPFKLVNESGKEIGRDMYIEYGHATGTHIEAAFFDPWGRHGVPDEIMRRYVRIPNDRLVARGCLLDLSEAVGPLQQVDYTHLEKADPGLQPGDICLIRADITDWHFFGSAPGKTPGLSPDAAKWLLDKKIRTLVVDFAVEKSDPQPSSPFIKYTPNKIHYFLHKNDIPIVEWAVGMKNIRKDRFTVAICSLNTSHWGGHPAHVFVVEEW